MSTGPELPASESPSAPSLTPRRPLWRRILGLPGTWVGWWSVGLAVAFFVFFGLFQTLVAAGQRGGATFFSNPWLALSLLTAAGSAIAAGVTAAVAIFSKGERSLLVFLALLLGLFVLVFALGELLVPH